MPGYFGVIGMPIRRGRDFSARDNEKDARAVIVSETFARLYFPNQEPIGRRLTFKGKDDQPLEIAGVVGDVKNKLDELPEPCVYMAYAWFPMTRMGIVLRTASDPAAIAPAARAVVADLDPTLPISNLKTVEQIIYERTTVKRLMTVMMVAFSVIALLMAGAGLYAVMAYAVSRRAHEIGIASPWAPTRVTF